MSDPGGSFDEADRAAMRRALELGARGLTTSHPNPSVGAVVTVSGRIVGEGWHAHAGGPHAEIVALGQAGAAAAGATVYTTLEPCSHYGRTPPCVQSLIDAGVARVVSALRDPNPLVDGKGVDALTRAGIRVEMGLMADEALELHAGYVSRRQRQRPWFRIKLAMSLDARTALADGSSRWITGEAARADVQAWRARSSAVLTGIGTVLADDPHLNVRPAQDQLRQPLRVVVDRELRTPPGAQLFAVPGQVILFTASNDESRAAALTARGARLERIAVVQNGLDVTALARRLAELEVNEVLVEAGAKLSGAFVQAGLADELLVYVAPKLLGSTARPLMELPAIQRLSDARRFRIVESRVLGADLRLRLRPA